MEAKNKNAKHKNNGTSPGNTHETLEVNALDELGRNQHLVQPRKSAEEIDVDEGPRTQRCDTAERELLKHHFPKIGAGKMKGPGKTNHVQSSKINS